MNRTTILLTILAVVFLSVLLLLDINLENKTQIKETRVVETLVSRIRKKLNKYNNAPKLLKKKGGYTILV